MQPTPEQLKKLEKLSKMDSDSDVVLLQTIEESKTELDSKLDNIQTELNDKIDSVSQLVSSIEIPEQMDDTDKFNALMSKLDEEIVVELVIT